MFHYAHLHSPLISSCHCKKLAEIIIGIFAFCTVTGMIALDKCGKHWGMTGSWEMPRWAWHQQFFWALALSCSPVAINSKLTKKSKGFLGLLTSSVEIVFRRPGKRQSFSVQCGVWGTEGLVSMLWPFVHRIVFMILKLCSCSTCVINEQHYDRNLECFLHLHYLYLKSVSHYYMIPEKGWGGWD